MRNMRKEVTHFRYEKGKLYFVCVVYLYLAFKKQFLPPKFLNVFFLILNNKPDLIIFDKTRLYKTFSK